MLGEDTTLKLSQDASFRQKLTLFSNTQGSGGYRFVFEAGLSVALNSRMNLTAGFTQRYENDPGLGLKNSNGLLITGISFKLD
jgi:putative salt-induced outer membrane protein